MVKLTSIAAGVAAIAATVSATTTLAQSDERVNLVELGVYVSDIRAHLAQYYMFQAAHPTETYPVEVAEAVFNYGDFTTMLTGIAPRPSDQNDHRCPMVLHQIKASYLQGSIQGRYLHYRKLGSDAFTNENP
ncbi:AFI_G0033200.mRNA.1.CDS.1 [Saccharomyces cerevisiae]|nr:AFI_G0033200.mRNA.1.CDS.1 [Saccharomyces cerevisiae]CAI6775918.1 AFI_G0033200.mRNA.1.CDS.1 [Saccharomyces cerevisiae]